MKTALQCILAAGLASVVFAAPAQDASATAEAAATTETTDAVVAADADGAAATSQQETRDADAMDPIAARFCLRETGSRIVEMQNAKRDQAGKRCVNAPGRVYTNDDIRRTGAIDLTEALRMLDPAIQ